MPKPYLTETVVEVLSYAAQTQHCIRASSTCWIATALSWPANYDGSPETWTSGRTPFALSQQGRRLKAERFLGVIAKSYLIGVCIFHAQFIAARVSTTGRLLTL